MVSKFKNFFNRFKLDEDEAGVYQDYADENSYDDFAEQEASMDDSYGSSKSYLTFDEPKTQTYSAPKTAKPEFKAAAAATARSTSPSHARAVVNVIKPKEVNDWRFICEDLVAGKVTIINFEGSAADIPQRVTDSVAGAAYALGAKFRYINQNILILVPADVELTGNVQKSLAEKIGEVVAEADTAYDYDNLDDIY